MLSHLIIRTSPKGGPFLGTCKYCGQQNLKIEDANKECPKGKSTQQALIEAIDDSNIHS